MAEFTPETRRLVRAYLHAVAVAEPLQRELARRYGLAIGDIHALRVLRDRGRLPISHLGAAVGVKPSNATNLVDRLEAAGLVVRSADGTDRRVTSVCLTSLAEEALSDRDLVESTGLVARFERLTAVERLQLAALLEQIADPAFDALPPPAGPAEVGRALEAATAGRTIS